MAPSPITPSFLPSISFPAKLLFSFSTSLERPSAPLFACTQLIPPTTSRAASKSPAITSSLTAFALAPGVLNTTIPCSAHLSRGMLFTPAPALATARRLSPKSIDFISALLTRTASASFNSSVKL